MVRRLLNRITERTSRSDVESFERIGAPDLAPVLLVTMQKYQNVVTGGFHHGHGTVELLAQHLGDPLPGGAHLILCLDHEYGLWPTSDYVYMETLEKTRSKHFRFWPRIRGIGQR